ncbi:MAG: glycosyltransferase [Legionella sp.]|jgi:GT2 family glycosyltransferase
MDDLEIPNTVDNILEQAFEQSEEVSTIRTLLHQNELNEQTTTANQYFLQMQKQIHELQQDISDKEQQLNAVKQDLLDKSAQLESSRQLLAITQAQLLEITKSNSWFITLPLRELRRWLNNPMQQLKRYTLITLLLAKRVYNSIPFKYQTQLQHKNLITRFFPRALLATRSYQPDCNPLSPTFNKSTNEEMLEDIRPETIIIPSSATPIVSIIIPIYGKIDYTLRCLHSIAHYPAKAAFELLIVDDHSPDNSVEILKKVTGIHLICNQENQGFIRSCNNGAKEAKGEYLCFLNNDTQVTPNWMDNLLRTFKELPGTGLAGSKLIYPDGTLQEAGGIIWGDGNIWNFGRGQNLDLPKFNYAREVDYCSGASIMIPKTLFDQLGGFDEYYLPAYCEDTDLALKVRDKGYRVIYQPLSVVIHHEGITSGTDITQGTKAYQVENTKKLFTRWASRLEKHQTNIADLDNAKDRRAKHRVLVIDHCTPTPNQDAGSMVTFNMMLLFREMGFQVTFIPEHNFLYMPEYTTALQRVGIEVLYAPYNTNVVDHLKEYGSRYDLTVLIRPGVAKPYLKSIHNYCPSAKIIYLAVDLHFLRISREAELYYNKAAEDEIKKLKEMEIYSITNSDVTLVHSSLELDVLRNLLPKSKIHLMPLIMDIQNQINPFAYRKDIAFVGGYQHKPNVDAVHYFASHIMPILRKQLPGVRFHIIGSNIPPEFQTLACNDIIIKGFVNDLNKYLSTIRLMVAPLRYGAGVKGKVATSLSIGLPAVATPIAVEGMFLSHKENILVADNAQDFATAISTLYGDENLWNKLSLNGLEFAEKNWGKQAIWDILAKITSDLGLEVIKAEYPLSVYCSEVN